METFRYVDNESIFVRWQILNEEIDCTEEEMMLFAALQLQVLGHRLDLQHLAQNIEEFKTVVLVP